MNKKQLLLNIAVCTALLTNSIFAGIYQVVVLRSPDGTQRVRLYFDMHTLGTTEQNKKQFNIIQKSITKFSAAGKPLNILIESPNFYRPLEDDWVYVLGEKEKPQDIQAITKKTVEAQKQQYALEGVLSQPHHKETIEDIWSNRSSIFHPIPYLIGSKISPENPDYKKIRIISVDSRDILQDLTLFVENNILLPSVENSSLKDVFDKTLKQTRNTIATIDSMQVPQKTDIPTSLQEKAAITLQAAIRGHLARTELEESKQHRQKIKTQYEKFERELTLFMQVFEEKIGEQAWNRRLEADKKFEEIFTPKQQTIIKKQVNNAILSTFTSWLEYDLLKNIVEPSSAKEIAVFVGGSHAKKMISILAKLDYRVIYQKGYTSEFIDLYFDREKAGASQSAYGFINYYPPEALTLINSAITETLTPHITQPAYNIDAQITNLLTPDDLRNAVFQFDLETIKLILTQAPNSNILVNSKIQLGANKPTNTPLHIATTLATSENKFQAIEAIKTLLMFGANPHLMDSDGKSVFDITDDPEITEILNTYNINKKYFDMPEEEVATELTKLIKMTHISFQQAQLKSLKNQNFEQDFENSLITLSQLHYLISKLELNTEAKQDLKIALTELEIACMRAQQEESLSPNFRQALDAVLAKIRVVQVVLA